MNPSLMINCLLSVTLLLVATEADLFPDADVLIYNMLSPGTDLILHCKSRDDDLGVQVLGYGNYFEFTFTPNWWDSTLFYCSMEWNGALCWFDIYKERRDYVRCDRCLWNVKPDGPCLSFSEYEICYLWNSCSSL